MSAAYIIIAFIVLLEKRAYNNVNKISKELQMLDIFSVAAIAELGFETVLEKSENLDLPTKLRGVFSIDDFDNIEIMPIEGFHSASMALPSHTLAGEPIYDAAMLGSYLHDKGFENRIYDDIGALYLNGVRQSESWLKTPPVMPKL